MRDPCWISLFLKGCTRLYEIDPCSNIPWRTAAYGKDSHWSSCDRLYPMRRTPHWSRKKPYGILWTDCKPSHPPPHAFLIWGRGETARNKGVKLSLWRRKVGGIQREDGFSVVFSCYHPTLFLTANKINLSQVESALPMTVSDLPVIISTLKLFHLIFLPFPVEEKEWEQLGGILPASQDQTCHSYRPTYLRK